MDRTATLTSSAENDTRSLIVDHAVFTSIRSPMGEGYRIIAATSGIRPDERMETTRRAPSHGGLATDHPDALGVIGFPLPTGRYCVGLVRHAGKEHTARGGLRVHTHFVFLDRAQFGAFACDPWLVAGVIAAIDGDEPLLKAESTFPKLSLGDGCAQLPDASPRLPAIEVGWLQSIVEAALRGAPVVANAGAVTYGSEQLAWRVIPSVMRERRSMSIGIAYAPSRGLDVCFVSERIDETRRLVQGARTLWIDPGAPLPGQAPTSDPIAPPRGTAEFDDWMALTRATLESGRVGELIRLCDAIDGDATPEGLATTARLYEHLDQVTFASADDVSRLMNRYQGFAPTCRAQKLLVERFRVAATDRLSQLQQDASPYEGPGV
ncbi:MAG: hypothetical protein H6818_18220 [Phycisphaerales bacterium]|nr:hypothetical protein [Phycisphaerales bacterium]MCB9864820.1 hypothetical protein [Phycisphaerales bacterium]